MADKEDYRRKYYGCRKKFLRKNWFNKIFLKPDTQLVRVEKAKKTGMRVPQTRTLRTWVEKYFDAWLDGKTDPGSGRSVFDPGGSWAPETVSKFFEAKDREFQRLMSGEKILQSRLSRLENKYMNYLGQVRFSNLINGGSSVATENSRKVSCAKVYLWNEGTTFPRERERERGTMMCAWAGWYEQARWGEGGAREKGAGGLVASWPEGEGARE